MRKILISLILATSSLAAMALPAPSQIENALAANDHRAARSMTDQVLNEKPESAKGHLFNAYILAHFENNPGAAQQELEQVRRLDKKGDVKNSPLFGRVVAELDAASVRRVAQPQPKVQYAQPAPATQPVVQAQPVQQVATVPVQHKEERSLFWPIVLILLIGGGITYVIISNRPKAKPEPIKVDDTPFTPRDYSVEAPSPSPAPAPVPATAPAPVPAPASEPAYVQPTRTYKPPRRQVYQAPAPATRVEHHYHEAPSSRGTSAADALVAAAAGAAVVGMISEHSTNREQERRLAELEAAQRRRDEERRAAEERRNDSWDAPAPAPAYVPSETRRESFSSGRSDDYETTRSSSFSSGSDDTFNTGSSSSSSDSSNWD